MCVADKICIAELTLIHKILGQINSHVQELTDIEIYCECDVKHILMSPIKTIKNNNNNNNQYRLMAVLKISTYIITSITAHPVGLAAILAIMSVSTFKTAIILYWFDVLRHFLQFLSYILPTRISEYNQALEST